MWASCPSRAARRADRRLLDRACGRGGARPRRRAARAQTRLRRERGRDARDGRDHRTGPLRGAACRHSRAPIPGDLTRAAWASGRSSGRGAGAPDPQRGNYRVLHLGDRGWAGRLPGTNDAIGRRVGIEVGTADALVVTAVSLLAWAAFASTVQVLVYRRGCGRGTPHRTRRHLHGGTEGRPTEAGGGYQLRKTQRLPTTSEDSTRERSPSVRVLHSRSCSQARSGFCWLPVATGSRSPGSSQSPIRNRRRRLLPRRHPGGRCLRLRSSAAGWPRRGAPRALRAALLVMAATWPRRRAEPQGCARCPAVRSGGCTRSLSHGGGRGAREHRVGGPPRGRGTRPGGAALRHAQAGHGRCSTLS